MLINKHTDWEYSSQVLETFINFSVRLEMINHLWNEVILFCTDIQEFAWASTPAIKNKLIRNKDCDCSKT